VPLGYLPARLRDQGGTGSVGAGGGDRKTRIGNPFAGRDSNQAVTACWLVTEAK